MPSATRGSSDRNKGEQLATNYVALNFETLGLLPAGDNDTFFQEFEFTSGVSAGPNNVVTVESTTGDTSQAAEPLTLEVDWRPLAFSRSASIEASDVIFAGYGIRAPAAEGIEEYDSFVHLEVKDKWVMVFRFMPENFTPEQRQHFIRFSSLRFKAMQARDMGARGLIIVSGPTSGVKEQLVPLQFDGSLAGSGLAVISVADSVAAGWFAERGKDLASVQQKMDSGEPTMGFPLDGLKIAASIDIQQEKKTGRNVLGRLQINESQAGQIVVVGDTSTTSAPARVAIHLHAVMSRSQIHFGADDNASGVSAMMQIAEAMALAKEAGKLQGSRDVVFAAWSGEELGLLGSSHYVRSLETLFSQHAAAVEGSDADADESKQKPKNSPGPIPAA